MSERALINEQQREQLRAAFRGKKQVRVDAGPAEDVPISLSITKKPRLAKNHVIANDSWDWRALRDYVEEQMHQRGYARDTRSSVVIAGICKGFIHRHGPKKAERIVRSAFDVFDGVFEGIPVTFQSLCANSDPHFAEPLRDRLDA